MVKFRKQNKKTKKGKKKSGAKDTDWEFEGGSGFTEVQDDEPERPKKRINTQERDERLRRSRRKQHDAKLKNDFAKKMASKVRFSDILAESNDGEDGKGGSDSDADEESDAEQKAIQARRDYRSPLSKLDRLQRFVLKSMERKKEQKDNISKSNKPVASYNDEDENDELDEVQVLENRDSDNTAQRLLEDYAVAFRQQQDSSQTMASAEVKEFEVNGEDSDGDNDDADGDRHATNGAKHARKEVDFLSAFVGQRSVDPSSSKYQLVKKECLHRHEFALYVTKPQVEEITSLLSSSAFNSLQTLPGGLYKLWQSIPRPMPLSNLHRFVLPSLMSYQDMFFEGRDMYNNDALLESMLMHAVFHTVKSRAKVVQHNKKLKQKQRDNALHKATAALQAADEDDLVEGTLLSKKDKAAKANNNISSNKSKKRKAPEISSSASIAAAKTQLDDAQDDVYRDQGFVRPRLLILCPFRHTARKIVDHIISILGPNSSVSNYEKFSVEYADPEDDEEPFKVEEDEDEDEDEDAQGGINGEDNEQKKKKKQQKLQKQKKAARKQRGPIQKPADWDPVFKGNVDDDFKMGIQVNPGHGKGSGSAKGTYLRLYSDFYISDILIASPIGLKLAMEASVPSTKHLDTDILSSLEQVIVHQADVLALQNWEHVDFVLRHVNLLPKQHRAETDYSRVRSYFLDGLGSQHRQLMLSSAFVNPEIQALFREFATSHRGHMRVKKDWDQIIHWYQRPVPAVMTDAVDGSTSVVKGKGKKAVSVEEVQQRPTVSSQTGSALSDVFVSVKQVFQIIAGGSATDYDQTATNSTGKTKQVHQLTEVEMAAERRFAYFKQQWLPQILKTQQTRTLVVASSYLDFVRLRNCLIEEEVNAAYISEYTSESDIGRARALFFQGRRDILLYSGRAHFFRRFKIRGARQVLFYGLPDYAHFYPEIVNALSETPSTGTIVKDNEEDEEGSSRKQNALAEQWQQDLSCISLVTTYESLALERVVGVKKAKQMLQSEKSTFVFF